MNKQIHFLLLPFIILTITVEKSDWGIFSYNKSKSRITHCKNSRSSLEGYKLSKVSSCIGMGKLIPEKGKNDFQGNIFPKIQILILEHTSLNQNIEEDSF